MNFSLSKTFFLILFFYFFFFFFSDDGFYVPPNPGRSDIDYWTDSPLAADHVAAGSFPTAMKLLHRQIGAIHFAPMKPTFLAVAGASKVQLNGLPGTAPMEREILRSEQSGKHSLPRVCITLAGLIAEYKQAKKCFGKNELEKSSVMLSSIFAKIPLLVVDKNDEDKLVRELLGGCREYMTGIRLEMERRKTKEGLSCCVLITISFFFFLVIFIERSNLILCFFFFLFFSFCCTKKK